MYTKRHHKFLFVEIQWLGLLVTAECLDSILWRLKVSMACFRFGEEAISCMFGMNKL